MTDVLTLGPDQLKCLASPTGNEIVRALRGAGEASAVELGRLVDRAPATVHYHLRGLVGSGLVREVGRRATARKPEVVYGLVAKRLRLPLPESSPEIGALTRRAVLAGLRQTMRGYEKAAVRHAPGIGVIRAHIRLSPADLETFNDMIEAAGRFANEHQTPDGVSVNWSSVVYPDDVS